MVAIKTPRITAIAERLIDATEPVLNAKGNSNNGT
jgi:hypothetical protein